MLGVGLITPAVEDVVGRDVNQPRAARRASSLTALTFTAHDVSALALADVDVVKGGAVEHELGPHLLKCPVERRRVGDVELGVR